MPVDAEVMDERWAPALYPKQVEVLAACGPSKQNLILVNGPRWASKCVSPDSLVWTAAGLKPIGHFGIAAQDTFSDINASVVSMRGASFGLARATKFYNSGIKEAICLRTNRGIEITCSPNHRLWSEFDGIFEYRTAEHIQEIVKTGQKLWLSLMREHTGGWPECYSRVNYFCKSKGHRRDLSITIDEEIGYLMGLMVGDGCYTPSIIQTHAASFASNDEEISQELSRVITARFPRASVRHCSGCDYRIHGDSFLEFLWAAGMSGKYAHEKTIPISILHSPKAVLGSFLQGLFDTDGTVDKKGRIGYCTTSPQLSREVQTCLLALGIRSTRRFHKNDGRGAWIISPQEEDKFAQKVGFRLKRKQARTGRIGKFERMRSSYPPSLIPVLSRLHKSRHLRHAGSLTRNTHKHVIDTVLRGNASLSKRRIIPLMDAVKGWGDSQFESYWMGGKVWWDTVETCESTQSELVDISVPGPANFVANGFINHNTFACQHAVCQHGWNTDRGNICLLTITQSVGVDSGVWQHLTEIFIPEWIEGGFGMEWVKEPYTQAITKKPACEINNVYGNKTRISLESLRNEDEVEARFKGKAYSMIWVNELSKFKKRKTFDTLKQCLRMPHLTTEQHLFLADTNPDLDLGVLSWIYMLWYEFRTADEEVLAKLYPDLEAEKLRPLQRALRLIEFSVDDNLSLSDEKKGELFADFASDPDLMAAYYYGKWVTASADALFYKVFQPNLHVIGEVETASNPEPLTMVPEENCAELILGIDPGVTNCAAAIMEKAFRIDTAKDGAKQQVPVIKVLDEMVIVGEDFSLLDYVEELVEKMDFWERMAGRPGKILWRQWSDRSVFDMRVPFTDRLWHEHIYTASNGKIALNAANRGPGTVQPRVDLFRKLLYDHRLFISKRYCPQTIEMCKSLKKGSRQGEHVQRASRHKHIFDALTYAICSELSDELSREISFLMKEMRGMGKKNSVITVPM